ncbi:GTP 3',8-cyclase MoaA [Paenibacillus elgii]|uniref:GTP 3',8-cyclase MoaA n=1 Tax=Paenibacillus elgii TaxID=189691 RepID=UPI000248DFCD|nr:GTP 3',8-cyclase MoaA [Paenibacillus elgii]
MNRPLIDSFGRVHDYLRISVTDRCNLRCVYCMPPEGMEFEPGHKILSYEEIAEVVRVLAGMGVRKVRLTGGEPLVRKELETLVAMIAAVPGIEDIALTTNGIFLAPKAAKLKAAGLTRVNISLDSLRADRFAFITRGGDVRRVLDSMDTSLQVGLHPIKINVVLMKGINDDEIVDFLRLSMERPLQIRFIEYMPIGHQDKGWKASYMPLTFIFDRCREMGWKVIPCNTTRGSGPSENYRIEGAQGSFGLIHPVSDHFCETCNRLRLTADGSIKPCLYWSDEFNVRKSIGNDDAIRELFLKALHLKPQNHEMAKALDDDKQTHQPTSRRMSQIGG